MFEKKMRLDALYDFYGKMLTEKQSEIMDLFCNLDYSLGEISELHGISRQAVHDTIKRTEKTLENYEHQLGLFARFQEKQAAFERIVQLIDQEGEASFDARIREIKAIAERELE
jgi:hypothetical protein